MPSLIDIYQSHQKAFDVYQALLLKWNEKMNLTAIVRPDEIVEKHFIDSLAPLEAAQNVSRETFYPSLLDIGSGAGFPGLPMKIAAPEINLTCVDSVKKKCDFVKAIVRTLGLKNVQVEHLTLEGQAIGAFNMIVTRATLSLQDYLSLAMPNLKAGGLILAMKGLEIDGELKASEEMLSLYGLVSWESYRYELPYSKVTRQILMTHRASRASSL